MLSRWAKEELKKWQEVSVAQVIVLAAAPVMPVYFLIKEEYWATVFSTCAVLMLVVLWLQCCIWLNIHSDEKLGWKVADDGREIDSTPRRRKHIQALAPFYVLYFKFRKQNTPRKGSPYHHTN